MRLDPAVVVLRPRVQLRRSEPTLDPAGVAVNVGGGRNPIFTPAIRPPSIAKPRCDQVNVLPFHLSTCQTPPDRVSKSTRPVRVKIVEQTGSVALSQRPKFTQLKASACCEFHPPSIGRPTKRSVDQIRARVAVHVNGIARPLVAPCLSSSWGLAARGSVLIGDCRRCQAIWPECAALPECLLKRSRWLLALSRR